jgi:hypothetical protein
VHSETYLTPILISSNLPLHLPQTPIFPPTSSILHLLLPSSPNPIAGKPSEQIAGHLPQTHIVEKTLYISPRISSRHISPASDPHRPSPTRQHSETTTTTTSPTPQQPDIEAYPQPSSVIATHLLTARLSTYNQHYYTASLSPWNSPMLPQQVKVLTSATERKRKYS